MNRREWVRTACLGAAAVVTRGPAGMLPLQGGRSGQAPGRVGPPASQPAAPASPDSEASASGGDRLYDPSVVQERSVVTAADNDPAIKELEHRLKCTCGCNLDIYTCRTTDFTCTYSPALHREVLALRRNGRSPDQVVAAFVAKYGEQILMAPPPVGFNLAGYLVPGAAIAAAGAALAFVLVRRGRRLAALPSGPGAPAVPGGAAVAGDPADQERLRRALAQVDD